MDWRLQLGAGGSAGIGAKPSGCNKCDRTVRGNLATVYLSCLIYSGFIETWKCGTREHSKVAKNTLQKKRKTGSNNW